MQPWSPFIMLLSFAFVGFLLSSCLIYCYLYCLYDGEPEKYFQDEEANAI
jgi:hypothetical protein